MRLNQYIAKNTGLSRRAADKAIAEGRVEINRTPAELGHRVNEDDTVTLDGRTITPDVKNLTIMFNKPAGYVCSRAGQGNKTIYDLLPKELHHLKPVGRLDKDSSGLILLINDGQLANQLTHPRYQKAKVYEIKLNTTLDKQHFNKITKQGVELDDGLSQFRLEPMDKQALEWQIIMHEGRNRQIRRTFETLGYRVQKLHRTHFGDFKLGKLSQGNFKLLDTISYT